MTFAWLCGKCGGKIGDDEGGVRVLHAEIRENRRAEEAHGFADADLHEFLLGPVALRWSPLHYACDERGADAYGLDVSRLRSWRQALTWTAHLMSKNWLTITDWDELLREMAGEASERVTIEHSK